MITLPKTFATQVGGHSFCVETLDDLDRVIDQLVPNLAARTGLSPSAAVAEACPHFGVVWPAALALCDFIGKDAVSYAGKSVLELGCGLALPSMMARRLGARRVVASDRHPLAGEALRRNLARNRVDGVEFAEADWRKPWASRLGRFDVVLGSDLLYEPWQPTFLANALTETLAPNGVSVIADPGRRYVDPFVAAAESLGLNVDLQAVTQAPQGSRTVDVMILVVRR